MQDFISSLPPEFLFIGGGIAFLLVLVALYYICSKSKKYYENRLEQLKEFGQTHDMNFTVSVDINKEMIPYEFEFFKDKRQVTITDLYSGLKNDNHIKLFAISHMNERADFGTKKIATNDLYTGVILENLPQTIPDSVILPIEKLKSRLLGFSKDYFELPAPERFNLQDIHDPNIEKILDCIIKNTPGYIYHVEFKSNHLLLIRSRDYSQSAWGSTSDMNPPKMIRDYLEQTHALWTSIQYLS